MLNDKYSFGFKILGTICIVSHLIISSLMPKLSEYFSLFTYLESFILHVIFSSILLTLLWIKSSKHLIVKQLFLAFIFIDTIVVYAQKINFLIHVILFAILSRIALKLLKISKKRKSIQEHLID